MHRSKFVDVYHCTFWIDLVVEDLIMETITTLIVNFVDIVFLNAFPKATPILIWGECHSHGLEAELGTSS